MTQPLRQVGRYMILSEIGRGGMGVVYRATDPAIDRPVAIKTIVFRDEGLDLEIAKQRFVREARLAGAVSHPHVVVTHDAGEQDGMMYMVMELVDGESLERVIEGPGKLTPARTYAILRQTAAALDYLHAKGIVHRDLKPGNVLIDARGLAKLTDFGIAKALSHSKLTRTGLIVGTPHYMSPEQILGKAAEAASDQFSLGVIAWQMLTGRRPFEGEAMAVVTHRIAFGNPPSLPVNSAVSPDGAQVLVKALSKDPCSRYATCTEFVNALEAAAEEPVASRLPAYVATAAALAMIPLGAWVALGRSDSPSPPAPQVQTSAPSPVSTRPLDRAKSAQPPITRQYAEEEIPIPQMARVRVNSTPPGAKVTFDNDPTEGCTTPCEMTFSPGRHTLAASAAGYRKALKIFDVPTTTGLYLFLEEERGTLTISTTPSGGNITVDGRPWPQKTPASLALPPGKYSIKLDYEGVATEVRVVVINDRESPHLSADFRPLLERNAAEKSREQR